MGLAIITAGFMALTIIVKWYSVTALTSKRSQLNEANELNGQAKFRLKVAVKEVTNTQTEIDKLKRKAKTATHKIDKLKSAYQNHSQKAQEAAKMNAEKLRLSKELKKRKGET